MDEHIRQLDKLRAAKQACRELAEAHRNERAWRMCGLYVEHQTADQYTLHELEQWRQWSAFALRGATGTADVRVVCFADDGSEIVALDWSPYFEDVCGDIKTPFSWATAANDLYGYVTKARG